MTVQEQGCWCCGGEAPKRGEDDPWQGCMDGYCAECATNRCDCYPDECPVKHPDGQEIAIKCPKDVQTIREQLQHLGPLRAGAALAALDSLVAYVERLENGLRHYGEFPPGISEATETVAVVEAEVMHTAILDALDFSTGWSRPMADRERLDHITKLLTAALPASTTAPLAPPKESL